MISNLTIKDTNHISGGVSICECGIDYTATKHAVFYSENCYYICCKKTNYFTVDKELYYCTPRSLEILETKTRVAARAANQAMFREATKAVINKITTNLGNIFKIKSK